MRLIIPQIAAAILFLVTPGGAKAQESELDKIVGGAIPHSIRYLTPDTLSWSPLAYGQVIASARPVPIIPHHGFHPSSPKKAVLWTNSAPERGDFEVLDLNAPDQPVLFRDSLRHWGFHAWGGYNLIADFSHLRAPGDYQLLVRLSGSDQSIRSSFTIRRDLFQEFAATAFRWFILQCRDSGTGDDKAYTSGGWYDSGHLTRVPTESLQALYALERYHHFLKSRDPKRADTVKNALYRQLKHLCSGTRPDGSMSSSTRHGPERISFHEAIPVHIAILTIASRLKIPPHKLPGLRVARRLCLRLNDSLITRSSERYHRYDHIDLQSWLLRYSIAMYQSSGDRAYLTRASGYLTTILGARDTSGFFFSTTDHHWLSYNPETVFDVLYDYYRLDKNLPYRLDIADTFYQYASRLAEAGGLTPMGHSGCWNKDGYNPVAGSRVAAFNAWLLAFTYSLYPENRFLHSALSTFDWIRGYNPANRSLLAGIGHDPGAYHHLDPEKAGCPSGSLPGGVLNGFISGQAGLTPLNDEAPPADYVIAPTLPALYPILDIDSGLTNASITNGYHTSNNAWFIMAAMLLDQFTDTETK